MVDMDKRTDNVCDAQGCLFREVEDSGYDLEDFVSQYMMSNFVKIHIDQQSGRFRHDGLLCTVVDASDGEIQPVPRRKSDYIGVLDAYNIGYVYRGVCELTGLSSREVFEKFPFERAKDILIHGDRTYDEDIELLISMLDEIKREP